MNSGPDIVQGPETHKTDKISALKIYTAVGEQKQARWALDGIRQEGRRLIQEVGKTSSHTRRFMCRFRPDN